MSALAPARRVRTLRLAAADEGLARRGAYLIEDALRTASLPGGDGGQLLLVRRLALGRILPGQSPASVALAIEQGVWRLGGRPVHGADPAAATSPAVYFRDRLEAAILLALRLAGGSDVSAWFWPLAVLGWRPGMTAAEGLRTAWAAALQTAPGPVGVIALADALQAEGRLSTLLTVLRPEDGSALLAACGWPRPAGASAVFPVARDVPLRWRSLLAHWLAAWGATDARSLWLTATALASERPDAINDPTFVILAAHVAQTFAVPPGLPRPAASARQPPTLAPGAAALGPADEAGDGNVFPGETQSLRQRDGQGAAGTVDPTTPADRPLDKAQQPLPDVPPSATAATAPLLAPVWPWFADAAPTGWAGLYLLLPAMGRLGMAEMLAAQPHLAAAGLPRRVLLAVARRLRIPADDAALAPLARARPWRATCPFVLPDMWLGGLSAPPVVAPGLSLRRMAGRAGVRVLSADGLPLALWRGRAPEAVRALLREAPSRLNRGPVLSSRSDMAVLVYAWEWALRRWLARYAALTSRDVLSCPGRIAVTRTHLDVYFDHASADVRIRRAGLDLDPGWLPWFGRVVAYHYVDAMAG